jgi:hypothetical protein
MALDRLQKALIDSHIGPRASGLNCQNIFFFKCEHIIFLTVLIEIFILKRTVYHKCTLTYPKYRMFQKISGQVGSEKQKH